MAKNPLKITDTILRDAHQSQAATRMKIEDMVPILPVLDSIGYWSLECWGGATFDVCMRFLNEDPWERLRTLKKGLPNTKLQMLLRGQNILGYRHYADDVVEAFCKKSIENGIDVVRIFDALNDPRNMEAAMKFVKEYGGMVEAAISYTQSPVHNEDYFVKLAMKLEKMGADTICIKDMANLLLPYDAYSLVKKLKENVGVPIHLHTHNTTGTGDMTNLMAAQAGVDIVDCALSPLANGTSQPATESLVATLRGTSRDTGLDMNKLVEAAAHFRGVAQKLNIDPKVLKVDVNTLLYQVPGGMLSNLISQLKQANAEDKYYDVLEEIPRVRKDFGYPPLVTPTSQIVGCPGRAERAGRRALQDDHQGVQGPAPRRVRPAPRRGQRGGPQEGHRQRRGHHLPPRRPAGARDGQAPCRVQGEGPRPLRGGRTQLRIVPPGGPEVPGVARRPSHRGSPRCRPQGRGRQRPPHPHRRGPDRRRVLKQHPTAFGRAPWGSPFCFVRKP